MNKGEKERGEEYLSMFVFDVVRSLFTGAIAVVGGGAAGYGAGLGGHDGGVAVINGPSGAIHAGLGSHGAIIPGALGKY